MRDAPASPALWWDGLERPPAEPPLETRECADFAIVGGGYTGLWTAYFLKQYRPDAAVILIDAQRVGHGASGRNGGWLMGSLEGLERFAGKDGSLDGDVRRELTELVGAASTIINRERIDCDFVHGGCLAVAARYEQQSDRARAALKHLHRLGFSNQDYHWLTPDEISQRVSVARPGGGFYTPHVARIQPAKLVLGLRAAVKRLGVRIFEHTRARSITTQHIQCDRGSIAAEHVVVATEGYSEAGNPLHRRLVPVQTGMVATEPLTETQWRGIGLMQRETLADFSRAATYLQRTADHRLIIGARGHYHPGGLPKHSLEDSEAVVLQRQRIGHALLPQIKEVRFTHSWSGSVGVPRSFAPHIVFDPKSRLATAGGYVGEGVGASFLFGQTLAELMTQQDTPRSRMPWVKRHRLTDLKRWETEPLPRWGFGALMGLFHLEEKLLTGNKNGRLTQWVTRCCDWASPH